LLRTTSRDRNALGHLADKTTDNATRNVAARQTHRQSPLPKTFTNRHSISARIRREFTDHVEQYDMPNQTLFV
jgi:hypothetical protein